MKKIQPALFLCGGMVMLAFTILSTILIRPVKAAGDPIVVIVNVANPVESLTVSELKKLFMSDRSKWDTGKSVTPVIVVAGAPERKAFLKIVCGMNDSDFSKYFAQAAFNGRSATPPMEVGSSASVRAFVARSPGAIGFVKALDFHGDGSDGGVRAVKIEGIPAADSGYKIKM
jgi:ABC-type phosphate transport system substrate-binding protein